MKPVLETLGTGPVCRSLVEGATDPEETLRSEDDSRCIPAARTHAILAESPPPPPATRHIGRPPLALWDKGLYSVNEQLAQESTHVGDLGMGDLAPEEALCGMDDSLLRTHPMLAVPPPPLSASPPVHSLVPVAPPLRIHSNPGDPQVNARGSGRFGYWGAGSLPYDSAGSMEGPCLKPIGQDPIPRLPTTFIDSCREGDGKGDSPFLGEGGTGRTPPSLVVSAVGSEAREPISPVPSWEGDGTEPSSEPDQRPPLQRSRHSDTGQDPPVAPAIRVGGTEPTDDPPLAPAIWARGGTSATPISHSADRPHQVQQMIQQIEEEIRQAKSKANIDATAQFSEPPQPLALPAPPGQVQREILLVEARLRPADLTPGKSTRTELQRMQGKILANRKGLTADNSSPSWSTAHDPRTAPPKDHRPRPATPTAAPPEHSEEETT